MKDISYSLTFLSGVLSFLSPCVLPLVPSYVSYITGVSFEELTRGQNRQRIRRLTIKNSLAFIAGFSMVFILLGASTSLIGQLLYDYQDYLRIAGGILIIVFGLFIAGFLRLDFLMKEKKFHIHGRPMGYIGSFLIGMTFAIGWTPCVGPILGSILLYSGTKGSAVYGIKLLTVYSLGLAIPFFMSSLAINTFLSHTKVFYKFMRAIMILSGIVLIIFGIILITDRIGVLMSLFPDIGVEF
ncbi:MAG: cytochrome c biogenesis protein CcdA [Nitrospirae bacterium]|nr:cytochrome c biogenesis protein CcdA [Nitrospirota bacterium]